jgi:hypothetical protein
VPQSESEIIQGNNQACSTESLRCKKKKNKEEEEEGRPAFGLLLLQISQRSACSLDLAARTVITSPISQVIDQRYYQSEVYTYCVHTSAVFKTKAESAYPCQCILGESAYCVGESTGYIHGQTGKILQLHRIHFDFAATASISTTSSTGSI